MPIHPSKSKAPASPSLKPSPASLPLPTLPPLHSPNCPSKQVHACLHISIPPPKPPSPGPPSGISSTNTGPNPSLLQLSDCSRLAFVCPTPGQLAPQPLDPKLNGHMTLALPGSLRKTAAFSLRWKLLEPSWRVNPVQRKMDLRAGRKKDKSW